MKPYENLTRLGRIRRLRQVAIQALTNYDLPVQQIQFLAFETNTLFQARSQTGERYVVRIYSDADSSLRETQAEVFWLHALHRDTDLKVAEPVPRRDGEYITLVQNPGVPGEKRCVLFKWVPGHPLVNHLSPENYFELGRMMAELHDHAETLHPLPAGIQPKKWDRVFYYPGETAIFDTEPYRHLFPPERVGLLRQVIDRVEPLLKGLYAQPGKPILLHADIHFWNVHVSRGQLYLIDFEDLTLGYPVQDIAITLFYGRSLPEYPELCAAFQEGYASLRTWPVESQAQLRTLMAARTVNFINYSAQVDEDPRDYLETTFKRLAQYLEEFGSGHPA